ncbi:hypothetical protein Poli38472_001049 [Pythium oligandrum]|uniref:Uncharacterized protein n=1 Tax=Pythium oligandrum TaxID=41045 RepID=A0A8K1FSU1_PYTOL|nr:hypothetical protein Poli38472_001049 [Pythium oligandrum]|eukprot:TMW68893.1 hypothetical protein Poli38472_001049 [Pythium oligandrum]
MATETSPARRDDDKQRDDTTGQPHSKDRGDQDASNEPSSAVNNAVEATQPPIKPKANDAFSDDELSNVADEYAKHFSAAQVRVKMKRARLEAKIAAEEEMSKLRFAILQAEQKAEEHQREKARVEERYQSLEMSTEEIVKMHKRTLNGMRDTLELETLVASLETEKATKEALRKAFEAQNIELLRAQQRIEELSDKITNYQKTETVLAQSISHFQHKFATKDHQRAAQIDRIRKEVEVSHEHQHAALLQELDDAREARHKLQVEYKTLEEEHLALQESAKAVIEMQEKNHSQEETLRSKIIELETEKAVLTSKVDQVQKADAHLRLKLQTCEEQVQVLTQQNETLRQENEELGKIATDLMEMAEKQQVERKRLSEQPDTEGEAALARTRKRLRESIG